MTLDHYEVADEVVVQRWLVEQILRKDSREMDAK